MIAKCHCTKESQTALQKFAGVDSKDFSTLAEIEFRELPYFLVSRSREKWMEGSEDVNAVKLVGANEHGVVFNPGPSNEDSKRTFVPWQNIISFSFFAEAESSQDGEQK